MILNAFARLTALKSNIRKTRRKRAILSYMDSERRPWSVGYTEYKEEFIQKAIEDPAFNRDIREGKQLPEGYGYRLDERCLEIPWVLANLGTQSGRLLDAGSSLNFEYILKSAAISKLKTTIITLAPEEFSFPNLGVSYVYDDLRNLPFKDDWFDNICCISTIEHVGMDNSLYTGDKENEGIVRDNDHHSKKTRGLKQGISELKRILKPGGILYISFPFGKYEDHEFFQQFDAELIDVLINTFEPSKHKETIFRYDPSGWVLSDREGCKECRYFNVHTSKYFDPNSTIEYPSDYTAGVRAVALLELKK